MVFALPELGAMAVAIFALLVLFGFEILRRIIAYTLGQLPFIGGQVAGAVEGWLTDAFDYVSGWLNSAVSVMSTLWRVIYSPLSHISQDIVKALESTANFAARVTTVYIPNAVDWVANAARTFTLEQIANLTAYTNWVVGVTVGMVNTLRADMNAGLTWVADAAQQAIDQVQANAIAGLDWLAGVVQGQISALAAQFAQEIANAISTAATATAALESRAATAYSGLELWAERQLVAAGTYAQQLAADTYAAVFKALSSVVHDTLAPLWADVVTPARTVAGLIPGAISDAIGGVEAIPQVVPVDVAGALAAIAAVTIPLTTYVEECGVPLCTNLNGFGREISGLASLFGEGALLAFLVEVASDPAGAVTVAEDVLVAPAQAVVNGITTLVGV